MAERDNWDGRNQRKWHVNREISLGDVIGLLAAIAAVLLAYGKIDTRVSLLEQSQTVQTAAQDSTTRRIESNIAEMNHKLDRLIERRP